MEACDRPPTSFSELVAGVVFPRRRAAYLLHVAATFAGLSYWLGSLRHEPGLPLSVRALYYPLGDHQYLSIVGALARGNLGESVFFDSFQTGVQAFPVVPFAAHAAAVALFGSAGYVVGDALTSFAHFAALAMLLRALGVSDTTSRAC